MKPYTKLPKNIYGNSNIILNEGGLSKWISLSQLSLKRDSVWLCSVNGWASAAGAGWEVSMYFVT